MFALTRTLTKDIFYHYKGPKDVSIIPCYQVATAKSSQNRSKLTPRSFFFIDRRSDSLLSLAEQIDCWSPSSKPPSERLDFESVLWIIVSMLFFGATAPNLPCWFDSLDSVEVTSVLDPEFCIPQTSYTSASCCQTFTWPYTSVCFSILKTQYICLVYVHIAVLLF